LTDEGWQRYYQQEEERKKRELLREVAYVRR
jgi:hypothetical protein